MTNQKKSALIDNQVSLAGKYLIFELEKEEYAVEILKVQEIIGMVDITKVPNMPEYIKGVMNLRGKIIPIIDLRSKFHMDKVEYTERTCIIVLQLIDSNNKNVTTGIIVDEVSEVEDIDDKQIELSPEFGSNIHTEFILGMGKINNRVVILLNIEKILSEEDFSSLQAAAE